MKIIEKLSVFLFLIFALVSCETDSTIQEVDEINSGRLEGQDSKSISTSKGTTTDLTSKSSCGGYVSGSYSVINSYHNYTPYKSIDISCAAMGSTITVSVVAYDIPNRFTIRDANGSFVKSSGWMGTANYPGPWGFSLSTTNTKTMTFTKTTQTYQLQVETQTPPNYSYNPTYDSWGATTSCSCCSTPGCSTGTGGTGCTTPNNCGDLYTGNYYTINNYYTYPDKNLDVHCVATGSTIQVSVTALDIPNRFTVKDSNGNTVAYTGWMGTANYPGPWGMSLSTSNTATLSFTKSATVNIYKLKVETQNPPNYSYSPTADGWQATLGCTPQN
ncbi:MULTISPECIES: hypothetical protein [Flavobacteriaceae]|uniref:hypothetical protein n=1 Tax=Flavobacteriaceae TaxID=49546 RepID=UPI0014929CA0|nr:MULTISPECIES: hypothetical protein [Allomuricauda]MDC6367645.1 hypothetical protein [Muricauda sp. AC10]